MNSIFDSFFRAITGNLRAQKLIQQTIDWLNVFTGVGAGGSPGSSGESSVMRLLEQDFQSSQKTQCVFDVGANDGGFIHMVMANHGQQKLFIHAFEPGTTSFEALQKNTSHLRDLKLNHFGLGAAPAEMTLYSSEPGSALASLTKRRLDHFKRKSDDPGTTHSETVRIDTLDAYCEREMIDHIDLLKIDVEGHELDVLAGAMRMLEGGKIRYLTFEFGGCNIDTRTFFQDYWYFFKKFPTAQIFRLTPSGFLLPIRKYQETQEQFRASNFLVKF